VQGDAFVIAFGKDEEAVVLDLVHLAVGGFLAGRGVSTL
jgi:hypothetical protein